MALNWNSLPPRLLEPLLAGSVGKPHLAAAALAALSPEAARPDLGLALLAEAWAHDPLDADLPTQILALDAKLNLVPKPVKALLAPAAKAARALRALKGADLPETSPEELFAMAEQTAPLFPAAAELIRARGHFLAGRFERAAASLDKLAAPLATTQALAAECTLRQGDRARAMDLYRSVCEAQPWHVGALSRLHDLDSGRDTALARPDGEVAILLYSWNKADDLDATLESLATSKLDEARITVLDNGSTDATPQVLEAWTHRLGERFSTLRLPSNIGAPAARNWLLTLPEVRAARWVAYLDDDILLPEDWLLRLGAAAEAYPEAGVWGCKVVDRVSPQIIQNADLHLRPARPNAAQTTGHTPLFEVTDIHQQSPDLGQFDCIRPCASVTGCCHLFRTSRLMAAGEFDIRFSPTQFDDLEHDLRLLLEGRTPVYTGHLTVRHARQSGMLTARQGAASGNAFGNQLKLQMKYTPDQIGQMRRLALAALLDDVQAKERALGL